MNNFFSVIISKYFDKIGKTEISLKRNKFSGQHFYVAKYCLLTNLIWKTAFVCNFCNKKLLNDDL